MTSGDLIRQARMLAGLSQRGLGDRIARPFTQIARWERNETEPGLSTLRRILQACGYDLALDLIPYAPDEPADAMLRANLDQSPSDRLHAIPADPATPFDPYGLIALLERHRISYVIVGDLAAVIRGTTTVTDRVEITPMLREPNLHRLASALRDLGTPAGEHDGAIDESSDVELASPLGALRVLATPAGTRGYRDLRRAATREALGRGLRPHVSPTSDLIRMAQADPTRGQRQLRELRRLAELDGA